MLMRPGVRGRDFAVAIVSGHRSHVKQSVNLVTAIEALAPNTLAIAGDEAAVDIGIERRLLHTERGTCLLSRVVFRSANNDHSPANPHSSMLRPGSGASQVHLHQ